MTVTGEGLMVLIMSTVVLFNCVHYAKIILPSISSLTTPTLVNDIFILSSDFSNDEITWLKPR